MAYNYSSPHMTLSKEYYKANVFSGIDKCDLNESIAKSQDIINQKISDNTDWEQASVDNSWIQQDLSKPGNFATTSTPLPPSAIWPTVLPQLNFSMLGVNPMPNLVQPSNILMGSMNMMGGFPSVTPTNAVAASTDTTSNTNISTSTSTTTTCASIVNCTGSTVASDTSIKCKSCTLIPPNPDFPPRTTREKPPGCKTIFVGGLPENCTEDLLREVFDRCGEILAVRISPKRFCHIKFADESAVDKAVFLSGYTITVGNDSSVTNRLHVDYAQARDDQYEWECRQRQLRREQRHRERLQERFIDMMSIGVHYTENEANMVIDKLKNEESFTEVIPIAVYWLERGECTRRNANFFYTMIQTCTSHVRRLIHEKKECEEEFRKTREKIKTSVHTILYQVSEIEKLFVSSSHKKVWDHFTKAQRKNIDSWRKYSVELKNWNLEAGITTDNEMDVSDSEDCVPSKKHKDSFYETNSLKDENDNLRCQLEAFKNEIDVIRVELQSEIDKKTNQVESLMQAYKSLQEKYDEAIVQKVELELKHREYQTELAKKKEKSKEISLETRNKAAQSDSVNLTSSSTPMLDTDARILGLISIFLHVHPFGVGLDYICSYLHKFIPFLRTSTVEDLMNKFTSMFQQDINGVGVNMERRWKFIGFDNCNKL